MQPGHHHFPSPYWAISAIWYEGFQNLQLSQFRALASVSGTIFMHPAACTAAAHNHPTRPDRSCPPPDCPAGTSRQTCGWRILHGCPRSCWSAAAHRTSACRSVCTPETRTDGGRFPAVGPSPRTPTVPSRVHYYHLVKSISLFLIGLF